MKKNQSKKSKIMISTFSLAAILTLIGFGITKANFHNNKSPNKSLIQALVKKFNLNESDVENIFNQHREEMRKQHQIQSEEQLNQAVSNGKITEDQKNLILEKKQEMQSQHQDISSLSFEERKQLKEEHREKMKRWAQENGIDMEFLHLGKGFGYGNGKGFEKGINQ